MNDARALYQQTTEGRIAPHTARDWPEHLLTEQDQVFSNMINGKPVKNQFVTESSPAKRANRAGTRGFRAPEVLFKCQSQSTSNLRFWPR
jgi:hypothetical protein